MTYTLQDYFTAVGLKNPVPFASGIEVILPELEPGVPPAPMEHQISGLRLVIKYDRYGLYDDPGTGKSLQSYGYILYWKSEGQRTLAVMPPILLDQYADELFKTMCGADKVLTHHILRDSPKKREALYTEWSAGGYPDLLCMSYQMFLKEFDALTNMGYAVLVADEAQALKNDSSGIFKKVQEFLERPEGAAFLPMTGTPDPNHLEDFYGLTKLLDPDSYKSKRAFDLLHSVYTMIYLKNPQRTKTGKVITRRRIRSGYKRTDLLRERAYKYARRVIRSDVSAISEPVITTLPIKLDKTHLALYKKLVRERILELEDDVIITALTEQSLRQKALQVVTCPDHFVADNVKIKNNILEAVQAVIDGVDIKRTKVILFCNFRGTVESVSEHFKKYNPAIIYGGKGSNKLNKEKFLNDDSCRVLVANTKSAGVGLNLQHVCHTIVFVEPTGVPGDFKQALERVVRHLQKNQVTVTVISAKGTIAPKAIASMMSKTAASQEVHQDRVSLLDLYQVA